MKDLKRTTQRLYDRYIIQIQENRDVADLNEAVRNIIEKIENNDIWFCPQPFCHVYTNMSGNFRVCCNGEESPHNIDDTTIEEWLNSDYLSNVKNCMLTEGYNPANIEACRKCLIQEQIQGTSKRIDNCADYINNPTPFEGRCIKVKMKTFGNQCNLDCYMCFPRSSSTREQSMKKIKTNVEDFYVGDVFSDDVATDDVLQQLLELKHKIHTLTIIGGEPLLMKSHYDLLDMLIESKDAPHINLAYQTNLTAIDSFMKYADKFNHIKFHVSIDGFGKYNDYIRMRSNFDDINENIQRLKKYNNVEIVLDTTISMLSILRYNLMVLYAKTNKIPHMYYIIQQPDCLHIRHLPNDIKRSLKEKYKNNTDIVNELNRERNETQFQTAMKYCLERDELYGTNVLSLYPELKGFIE